MTTKAAVTQSHPPPRTAREWSSEAYAAKPLLGSPEEPAEPKTADSFIYLSAPDRGFRLIAPPFRYRCATMHTTWPRGTPRITFDRSFL